MIDPEYASMGALIGLSVGIVGTMMSTVACLVWWLSRQFSSMRSFVYDRTESLRDLFLSKLDYHEKHDDDRFSQIRNDMWEMRLHQAVKDKTIAQEESIRTFRRETPAKDPC